MATKSVSEAFLDRLYGHEIDLLRFEAGTQRRVTALLYDLEADLTRQLRDIDPTGPKRTVYQQKRLETLFKQTKASIRTAHREGRDLTRNDMADVAGVEYQFIGEALETSVGVPMVSVEKSPEQLRRIADNTLIEGAPNKDWWAKQAGNLQASFQAEMRMGMAQGETTGQLIERVKRVSSVNTRQAEALVRTGQQSVLQKARRDSYEANADIIDAYQAIVTFDNRTTPFCISISGLTWSADGEYTPIGHNTGFPGWPPYHWRCRTTLTVVTKPWDAVKKDTRFKNYTPKQRASMDGQVPAEWSYEDWFKTKTPKFQKEVLGKARYDMWKAGKLDFRSLANQATKKPLTLDELRQRANLGARKLRTPKELRKDLRKLGRSKELRKLDASLKKTQRAIEKTIDDMSKEMARDGVYRKETIKKYKTRSVRFTKAVETRRALIEKKSLDILKTGKTVKFDVDLKGLDKERRADTKKGLAWLSKVSAQNTQHPITFKKATTYRTRSCCHQDGKVIEIAKNRPVDPVHEMGHALDHQSKQRMEKALAFYNKRTAGLPSEPLGKGYKVHERTKPDDFINRYTGKDYKGQSTEVVAMGLQHLYTDPIAFARKDPDHFDFIINYLRGT